MLRFTLVSLVLFLCGAGIVSALNLGASEELPSEEAVFAKPLATCMVKVIYDGDTLGCDFDGDGKVKDKSEHVRMLGIDAPEMHYSRKNKSGQDEPFAKEALERVKRETLNRPIYLVFDEYRFDPYDRTLAYVYLDAGGKRMLNAELVAEGLATVVFLRNNRRFESQFTALEAEAQEKQLNIWR